MGMPIITPGNGSRSQAITDLIESIALQEAALSHILNAEGEKMQAIIAMPDTTREDLLDLNDSVNSLLNAITRLEMMFQSKLELVSNESGDTPIVSAAAAEQLAKINVTQVTITTTLTSSSAENSAAAEAIDQAQAQVAAGYTVDFMATGYDPVTATLSGVFTVTNDTNPLDTATDAAPRTIEVISALTTAADELAKIIVTEVTIHVPLSDPGAETSATEKAIAEAQSQVAERYMVSSTATGYDLVTGILNVLFTVTNNTDPLDTASDIAPRTIDVIGYAVKSTSNAAAQFLDGSLLGVSFSAFPELATAKAHYENGTTPGDSVVNTAGIDLSVLGSTPLNGVLELGLVSQYAEARRDGASNASSDTASAGLDLMALIPANPILSQADLAIGAVSSSASYDAATDLSSQDYNIAGATLNLQSPLIATAVAAFNFAASTASQAVGGLGSAIINGLLSGVNAVLGPLNDLLPGLDILSNDLNVEFGLVDFSVELAPLLQEPIVSGDGALILNMSTGTLNIDLSKLTGLNDLPPNTGLLSDIAINALITDLAEITLALESKITDLVISKLTGTAQVTISGGVDLLTDPILGITLAGVGMEFSGTLADLLSGASKISLTGKGTLAPFTLAINALAGTAQAVLAGIINPILNDTIFSVAIAAIVAALTTMTTALSPVFQALADVISIVVNVQNNTSDTISETALQINLLSGVGTLVLATSVAGPNTYSTV